ncbi:MAG TPA: chorismate lyase [Burkholderiaceae bacterium]|nr:chorismate lyase [Burkholderiaceae bacterium]
MDPEAINPGNWHELAPPSLTHEQKHWLLRPGALTAGLRQLGHVDLTVVSEYTDGLSAREAWMVRRPPGSAMHIREIKMAINGVDSVVARSFTPRNASFSWWRGMRALNRRPLADMLYHNPQITRSRFFVCRLRPSQPLYGAVKRALVTPTPTAHELFARCSVFWRHGYPLLVAECFLPGFWPLTAGRPK